jgi:EpsI family protein
MRTIPTNLSQSNRPYLIRAWLLCLLLIIVTSWGNQLKVRQQPLTPEQRIVLSDMIPRQFAQWQSIAADQVIQGQTNRLERLVKEVYVKDIARTYLNQENQQIMLSVAYGNNQLTEAMHAHRPEFCYQAQGFELAGIYDDRVTLNQNVLPVRRMTAYRPGRHEVITYWMTIGQESLLPGFKRKWIQLKNGLTGHIPDGFVIRVSSIDKNPKHAYQLHNTFIHDLFEHLDAGNRAHLLGLKTSDYLSSER